MTNYGEPLLDERLEEFIAYIKNKLGIKPFLFTNGDLLTVERLRNLVNSGLAYVHITQHGNQMSKNLKEFFNQATKEDLEHIKFEKRDENSLNLNRGGLLKVNNNWNKGRFCRAPANMLIIRANGTVSLCCNDYYNKVIQGDLNKQSIMEIWKNPVNKRRREELSKGNLIEPICKACRV